jgi:hypothetical protein
MKANGQLHAPAAFISEKGPGTYWLGGCIDPGVSLEAMEKRKILRIGNWTETVWQFSPYPLGIPTELSSLAKEILK